jgi:hypothetical protein
MRCADVVILARRRDAACEMQRHSSTSLYLALGMFTSKKNWDSISQHLRFPPGEEWTRKN